MEYLKFFEDHPLATLFIGFLFCVISFLIYKLLKKDINVLSTDTESKFGILKKDISVLSTEVDAKFEILKQEISSLSKGFETLKKDMDLKFEILKKDMDLKFEILRELLTNHITDTNKKVEKLETKVDKLDSKVDQLLEKNKR